MRILIISPDYPQKKGGVSDYTCFLAEALADKGDDVLVLTSVGNAGKPDSDRVSVLPLVDNWGVRGMRQIMRSIPFASLDWLIFQYVPYMYERHGIPFNAALFAVLLKKSGVKLMTVFHEVAIRFSNKPKYLVTAVLQRLLAFFIGLLSDEVVVTTEFWQRRLKLLESKISRIPIGSNVIPVRVSDGDMAACRDALAPEGQKILATFSAEMTSGSGNPYTRRRLDLLVKALTEPSLKQVGISVVVLGGIQEEVREAVLGLAEEIGLETSLTITGFLPAHDLFTYLSVSDALVLIEDKEVNRYGGVSTKSTFAAASFAAGLPLIANMGELTDKFFVEGSNVLLIEENNLTYQRIANRIAELFEDQELQLRLRCGGRRSYEEELSWDAIGSKYAQQLRRT